MNWFRGLKGAKKAVEVPIQLPSARSLDVRSPLKVLEDLSPAHRLRMRLMFWGEGCFAGNLVHFSQEEVEVASSHELVSLAAIKAEAGMLTDAVRLVNIAQSKDVSILDGWRYIGLTSSLAAFSSDVATRYADELAAAGTYRALLGKFEGLILQNRTSIAVVGNSPGGLGRGRGAEIDKRDLVIRFNNYSVASEFVSDYGHKTDVWIQTRNYVNIWRRDNSKYLHRVAPYPYYWRGLNAQDLIVTAAQFGVIPEDISPDVYYRIRADLGSRPSSGLTMLFWIKEILGSLEGVLIAGFSLNDQVEGPAHYFSSPERNARPPHKWDRERKLYNRLVRS